MLADLFVSSVNAVSCSSAAKEHAVRRLAPLLWQICYEAPLSVLWRTLRVLVLGRSESFVLADQGRICVALFRFVQDSSHVSVHIVAKTLCRATKREPFTIARNLRFPKSQDPDRPSSTGRR